MWLLSEQMYKNRTKGINIGLCVSDEASCLGLAGLICDKGVGLRPPSYVGLIKLSGIEN